MFISPIRKLRTVAVAAGATILMLLSHQLTMGQQAGQPSGQEKVQLPNGQNLQSPIEAQSNQSRSDTNQQRQSECSGCLGVVVGACPGDAVCVHDVIWGSPADAAGIQAGDYILSVDGNKVTTPSAFCKALEQKGGNQEVSLKLWSQSQQSDKVVLLATKSEKLPASHDAWLGVLLLPTEGQGIEIQQVVPGSPADVAGLLPGETIVRMNDREVKDIDSFVDGINDFGPETTLNLAIRGDGNERLVAVKLGAVKNAPMRFIREIYSDVMDEMQPNCSSDSHELIDQTLDQMRQQIRVLEEQVRVLQIHDSDASSTKPTQKSNDALKKDQKSFLEKSDNTRASSSGLPLFSGSFTTTAVALVTAQQDGGKSHNGNGNRDHNRNRYNNYSQQRYGYGNTYRNNFSRNGYSNFRGYTYPNYGNMYYSYGGRPYYHNYGGYVGYGGYGGYGISQNRIQFGNLGVYWY